MSTLKTLILVNYNINVLPRGIMKYILWLLITSNQGHTVAIALSEYNSMNDCTEVSNVNVSRSMRKGEVRFFNLQFNCTTKRVKK